MLVSELTLGRCPPGQRESVASPPASLLPLSSSPSLREHFGSEGCEGGGFGGQEGMSLGTASSSGQRDGERVSCWAARWEDECGGHRPWCFFPSQTTQPQALPSGGRAGACQHLPGALGLVLGLGWVFFSNLRSCARTLALCCVLICVCKTRAEDTSKLLQRHCRVTAPMDQKPDSCLHLSCLICKIWGWGEGGSRKGFTK